MQKEKTVVEYGYTEFEEGEIGESVDLVFGDVTVTATWLGSVSNGKELARAMRLMNDIAAEREAERRRNGKNQ